MPQAPGSSFRPVPGPADRDSFFAQQRRYRRRIWQLDALCALAVLLMGIPLSVVVSPLVWAAIVVVADLVNLIVRVPDVGAASFAILDRVLGTRGSVPLEALAELTAALVVPGIAVMVAAWLGLRVLVHRLATDAVLVGLGARPPRANDFEEHQLTNLVEEMAIAAGVPPPRVMLIDTPALNAGAVGTSHDRAVVLVTRGLLDTLDRDESQAVIGHVVASIGHGDLRVSLLMLGVAETLDLVTTLMGGPFSGRARTGLGHLLRLAFRRGGADQDATHVAAMLGASANTLESAEAAPGGRARLRDVLALPFVTAQAAFWMNRKVFLWLLVGPVVAWLWRARRYLADAAAVQLTRYPDALARALARLATQEDGIEGAAWSAHFFIFGQKGAEGPIDSILPFDPPIPTRIAHLRAAGATVDLPAGRKPRSPLATALLVAIMGPLVALVVLVMSVAAVALVYVTLAIDMLFLLPVVGASHLVLRSAVAGWLGR